jgi:NAD(P)-dependent dehydrogenase (short-subunit alcohol dehydrogenase family)
VTARALVTGAASGIGRATAALLAERGAAVACVDVNAAGLDETVDAIAATSGKAVPLTADVTDLAAVEAAVASAVAELGGLDAVANIAGVGDFTGDVTEVALDEWARVLAINLTGAFHISRATIPHLRAAGGGAIVNVASQFGLVGCLASPAYCASKAGLIGLTRAMAIDHTSEGIRVNCVCPGPIDTPMLAWTAATPELTARERTRTQGRNLAGRSGRPEEIAATIAFLLSDEVGFMSGSIVPVDGGWTAG